MAPGANVSLAALIGPSSPLGGAATLLNSVNASGGSAAAAAVTAQRQNLLALVASSTAGGAPPDPAAVTATANLLQSLTANPAQLTGASQASAVSALSSLLPAAAPGQAPAAVSADTANAIASTASSVALAAVLTGSSSSGSGAGAAASNGASAGAAAQAVMASVSGLINSLADGQASTLDSADPAGPPPPPVVISTAAFQLQVQQDTVAGPGASRRRALSVTTAAITAPGSAASFSPLPASALGDASAVRTKFVSLIFDPHSTPGDAAAGGRNGMTTLSLSAAQLPALGSRRLLQSSVFVPLRVANLPHLITFSLPPPTTMGPGANASGLQAVCSFFDNVAGAYATHGCVSQPNPLPDGVDVEWVPNFNASNLVALPKAWNFSSASWASPLLANCTESWLDCSNASQVNRTLYPDPFAPFEPPGAVSCGGMVSARMLRVYWGHKCHIWREDNTAGCWWNTTAQAFSGGGCVAAAQTACGCTHLTGARARPQGETTPNYPACPPPVRRLSVERPSHPLAIADFSGGSAPTISVCSASDLLSLSPNDIITKLKLFLVLICALFGSMHAGAFSGWLQDRASHRAALRRLLSPACGFVPAGPEMAWTFMLEQARSRRSATSVLLPQSSNSPPSSPCRTISLAKWALCQALWLRRCRSLVCRPHDFGSPSRAHCWAGLPRASLDAPPWVPPHAARLLRKWPRSLSTCTASRGLGHKHHSRWPSGRRRRCRAEQLRKTSSLAR